jgi:hypothetical protein
VPEPVPLGQHADGLLDPDPRGQRMLELGHGHGQPRRLVGLVGWPSGGRSRRAQVGGQQVGQHHGTGQVGGLLRPDLPALPGPAHDHRAGNGPGNGPGAHFLWGRVLVLALRHLRVHVSRVLRACTTARSA